MIDVLLLQVELLSGGVNIPVTPLNVYEYVRKYAEYRMLVVAEQPLHVSETLFSMCILNPKKCLLFHVHICHGAAFFCCL